MSKSEGAEIDANQQITAQPAKRRLNLFKLCTESSDSKKLKEEALGISRSQAHSSRSGDQIEEQHHRSRRQSPGPPTAQSAKRCLNLFELITESFESEVLKQPAIEIPRSQASSSHSPGDQLEEQQHRSQRQSPGPPNAILPCSGRPIIEAPTECYKTADYRRKRDKNSLVKNIRSSVETTTEKNIDIPINDNNELRQCLIRRCEQLILVAVEQLSAGQLPSVSYKVSTIETLMEQLESQNAESSSIDNTNSVTSAALEMSSVFDTPESMGAESCGTESETGESPLEMLGQRRLVDFRLERSRTKFALIIKTLWKVHELLSNGRTETRRSFYYELKSDETASKIITDQGPVDQIVNTVANLLECAPWEMGLVPSAKGIAAGDMTLKLWNGSEINFTNDIGVQIPQIISNLKSIRTKAELVVVVEKDTVFQKLLEENCLAQLNCILVTGKGFPDVATRMLVKILAEKVELPVYVLVDADPYGVEIMCTYKYGSITLSRQQRSLACPPIRWLGLHPSELSSILKIPTIPLTKADVAKLEALQSRPYVNERLSRELQILRNGKAEIEAIVGDSQDSRPTSMYLKTKIKSADYI